MNRIVSPQELTRYNKRALSALFHQVSQELAGTAPGSEDRRRALTSLENIRRALAGRQNREPSSPGR